MKAVSTRRIEQYPTQLGVNRQLRHGSAQVRKLGVGTDRPQFSEQSEAIANHFSLGWIDKWELANITQTELQHAQNDRREVRTKNFRIGKLGSG